MITASSAHLTFVKQYLDWGLVQERLARYEHIERAYPLDSLKACAKKPPYYCHYLAWRLGTWTDETLFEFLDELLAAASSLDYWDSEKSLLRSCSFDDFWGLIWQLQVAKYFTDRQCNVAWMRSGPDLTVSVDDSTFYVECYTYRKSFALKGFAAELLHQIHPDIRIRHVPCCRFSLPHDSSEVERLLDELFRPYLDPGFLEAKLQEALTAYPAPLPTPSGVNNLEVYLEGPHSAEYVPGRRRAGTGSPSDYLEHAVEEAIDNKRNSNRLRHHRPNLVAVNFLLDRDYQLAFSRQLRLDRGIPVPDLGNTLDGVVLATCGIDQEFSLRRAYLDIKKDHPVLDIRRMGEAGHTLGMPSK